MLRESSEVNLAGRPFDNVGMVCPALMISYSPSELPSRYAYPTKLSVIEWLNTVELGGAGSGEACWIAKTSERCQATEPLQLGNRISWTFPMESWTICT